VKLLAVTLALAAATGLLAQPSQPLFSEDFESGRLDKNTWSQEVTGGNVIQVQQDKAAHGKYALLVRCPAPAQRNYAFIMAKNLPAALSQHHFGRAYVYITAKLPARHTVFLTAGTSGFPRYKYEEVATLNGRFQLTYVDQVGNSEDWHSGGSDIPLDRWFLLEWEFNDRPDSATVWVDGEKVYDTKFTAKATGATTGLVGGFTDIAFGFRLWGAAPNAFDIYYDDIGIDTSRLGPVKQPN
jgi:hypothetical protein